MLSKPINELDRRVILLPKETTYCEAYLAVSVRPEGNVVLGLNQQYSIFYTLCDLAALCEGGDYLVQGKVISPENYLKQWRSAFAQAKPLTDPSNQDLLVNCTMEVDPTQFEGPDHKYRREQIEELRKEYPYTEVAGRYVFDFDLSDPVHSKVFYSKHRLHVDKEVLPVKVVARAGCAVALEQTDLFGEVMA